MQGEIVKAGDPVLIRHHNTCSYLAADNKRKVKNDFGTELEVYCCSHSTKNKSQNLEMEYKGRLTSDVPTKFHEEFNVFYIHTAPEKNFDRELEELQKFDVNDLIKDLAKKIFEVSENAVPALDQIFSAMD